MCASADKKQHRLSSQVSNPLTAIWLFAGLAETMATVGMAAINRGLQPYLLCFVIGFPVLIALLFFATLNFNREALYAPSDFRDDTAFITLAMSSQVSLRKVQTHLSELLEVAEVFATRTESLMMRYEHTRRDLTGIGAMVMPDKHYMQLKTDLQQANKKIQQQVSGLQEEIEEARKAMPQWTSRVLTCLDEVGEVTAADAAKHVGMPVALARHVLEHLVERQVAQEVVHQGTPRYRMAEKWRFLSYSESAVQPLSPS